MLVSTPPSFSNFNALPRFCDVPRTGSLDHKGLAPTFLKNHTKSGPAGVSDPSTRGGVPAL